MKGVVRLTPIVPGDMQPAVFVDGKIREGFFSGNAAEGRGFPQWGLRLFAASKAHWFLGSVSGFGERQSLCGKVSEYDARIFLPGNYPRCAACERALTVQKRNGVV